MVGCAAAEGIPTDSWNLRRRRGEFAVADCWSAARSQGAGAAYGQVRRIRDVQQGMLMRSSRPERLGVQEANDALEVSRLVPVRERREEEVDCGDVLRVVRRRQLVRRAVPFQIHDVLQPVVVVVVQLLLLLADDELLADDGHLPLELVWLEHFGERGVVKLLASNVLRSSTVVVQRARVAAEDEELFRKARVAAARRDVVQRRAPVGTLKRACSRERPDQFERVVALQVEAHGHAVDRGFVAVPDHDGVIFSQVDTPRCVVRVELLHELLGEEEDERLLVDAIVLAVVSEEAVEVLVAQHRASVLGELRDSYDALLPRREVQVLDGLADELNEVVLARVRHPAGKPAGPRQVTSPGHSEVARLPLAVCAPLFLSR
mmetsp:Transcript_10779/g.35891  ORF Transcript_10779/g.35891 Transcript_10779/m.35891 type:complete len:376 (-) Transcript_10779:11-1138(-)